MPRYHDVLPHLRLKVMEPNDDGLKQSVKNNISDFFCGLTVIHQSNNLKKYTFRMPATNKFGMIQDR